MFLGTFDPTKSGSSQVQNRRAQVEQGCMYLEELTDTPWVHGRDRIVGSGRRDNLKDTNAHILE